MTAAREAFDFAAGTRRRECAARTGPGFIGPGADVIILTISLNSEWKYFRPNIQRTDDNTARFAWRSSSNDRFFAGKALHSLAFSV